MEAASSETKRSVVPQRNRPTERRKLRPRKKATPPRGEAVVASQ